MFCKKTHLNIAFFSSRSFTDYATLQDHLDNTMTLAEMVGEEAYGKEYSYMNGYDSPFKWWDRHNEDWLVKVENN